MRTATAIRDTSIKAYYELAANQQLTAQQRKIVAYLAFHAHRDHTRAEIAKGTGLLLQSVCGRVRELLDAQTIQEAQARPCRESGRSAHPLSLAPIQQEMFDA